MKMPATYRAQSRDLREAARVVFEPGEVVVWDGMAERREVLLLAPWFVRGLVWAAAGLVAVTMFLLSHRWWGGVIALFVLAPVAIRLRRLQSWLGPLSRSYYAVTDRRLVTVEPGAFFGVEPGVTSYRAENLPVGGTLKAHRMGSDLCLTHRLVEGGSVWFGLRSVPEADKVERLLAELKERA